MGNEDRLHNLDSTEIFSIMRCFIFGLHRIDLTAAYAKLSVSFSCMLLFTLDEFPHPTGIPSPFEIYRKDCPIDE